MENVTRRHWVRASIQDDTRTPHLLLWEVGGYIEGCSEEKEEVVQAAFEIVGFLQFGDHIVIPGIQVETFNVLVLYKGTMLQAVV